MIDIQILNELRSLKNEAKKNKVTYGTYGIYYDTKNPLNKEEWEIKKVWFISEESPKTKYKYDISDGIFEIRSDHTLKDTKKAIKDTINQNLKYIKRNFKKSG